MPSIGERTTAYRLTITKSGLTFTGDLTVVAKGPVVLYVAYLSYGANTDELVALTQLAYDKAVAALGEPPRVW